MEQAKAEAELARLERLERAHARDLVHLRASIRTNEREIDRLTTTLEDIEAAIGRRRETIGRRRETRGDAFAMTIQGQPLTKRPEAEAWLRTALASMLADRVTTAVPTVVAGLGGFDVCATVQRYMLEPAVTLTQAGVPTSELRLAASEIGNTAIVQRLENRLAGLEHLGDGTAARLTRLRAEVARAGELLDRPFAQAGRLASARARVHSIAEQLQALARKTAHDPSPEPAEAPSSRADRRREWARQAVAASPPQAAGLTGHPPAVARLP